MPGITITPADAEQLKRIAAMFRETGDKEIRNAFTRTLRQSTQDAANHVRSDIADTLPKKGGLNHFIAAPIKIDTDFREGRENIRFRLGRHGHDFRSLDRGLLRHPLFGNTNHWYSQHIPARWWEQYMTLHGDQVIQAIQMALASSIETIGSSLK